MIEAGNVAWDEKTYTFDLASRSDWTGAIHTLRLDPIQGANLNVTLKSIMLDLADGTTRTFDFTVPGATEQFLRVTNSQGAPVYTAYTGAVTRDSVKVSLYRKGETGGTTFDTGNGSGDAILTANKVMYQGLNTSDVKSVRFVMSGDSDSERPPELFYMSGSDTGFSWQKELSLDKKSEQGHEGICVRDVELQQLEAQRKADRSALLTRSRAKTRLSRSAASRSS